MKNLTGVLSSISKPHPLVLLSALFLGLDGLLQCSVKRFKPRIELVVEFPDFGKRGNDADLARNMAPALRSVGVSGRGRITSDG